MKVKNEERFAILSENYKKKKVIEILKMILILAF